MLDIDLFPLLQRINRSVANKYEARRRRGMIQFLESVDPAELEKAGHREALKAFQRAVLHVAYYRNLLQERGIDPSSITAIGDFARLPILEKKIFAEHSILELVRDHTIEGTKSILTSSGFSGLFSFGINLQKNLDNTARLIDLAMDHVLDITHRKTLIINCLPMGVKVYTNAAMLAEVSVRDDMALALIKKFGMYFEQIIIVGEAFFLKYLLEEGVRQGIDWKTSKVNLVAGEDSFPENYRTYMAEILGIDLAAFPAPRVIASSLGVAELDLNLFHETPDTIRLRRLAEEDPEFKEALFGKTKTLPMLFHYYPHRTYLEEEGNGEIIVTMTSPYLKIPLIRYNAKDRGKLISYKALEKILRSRGKESLLPRLHLPLIAVESRTSNSLDGFSADVVRHALFADRRFPPEVTGHFKLLQSDEGILVRLHLKQGSSWTKEYTAALEAILAASSRKVTVEAIPYYEFTEGLLLDYNKKFNHV